MRESLEIIWQAIEVIVTLVIIIVIIPTISMSIEEYFMFNSRYQALELSSMISSVQLAPDGTISTYNIPKIDRTDCIIIYKNYIFVDFGRGNFQGEIVSKDSSLLNVPLGGMKIDCTKDQKTLIISKAGGNVSISIVST